MLEKIQNDTTTVEKKLLSASEQARDIFETSKAKAQMEREAIINAAEQEAEKVIEDVRSSVSAEIKSEKEKIPKIVETLTQTLFEKALN